MDKLFLSLSLSYAGQLGTGQLHSHEEVCSPYKLKYAASFITLITLHSLLSLLHSLLYATFFFMEKTS